MGLPGFSVLIFCREQKIGVRTGIQWFLDSSQTISDGYPVD
jgi:hypothetical protein